MRPLTPASENLVPLNHLKTNINLPNSPGLALSAVSVCNDSFCGCGARGGIEETIQHTTSTLSQGLDLP